MSFEENVPTSVRLVAMDVVGFSRNISDARGLLRDRSNLFEAINATALFPRARDNGAAMVHFLGDELRIAFLPTIVNRHNVLDFVEEVYAFLDARSDGAYGRTQIRSILLDGIIQFKRLFDCTYLYGELAMKAQLMLEGVKGGQLATEFPQQGD